MAAKKTKKFLTEKGQSLVEFLLFLPFMIMMYSVVHSVSNAINASINQQKATRGYWTYRNQNNSTIPRPRRGNIEPANNWKVFGMEIMGWATELQGGQYPIAACFKFNLPFGTDVEDECDEGYNEEKTQFIRVKTVYGVCGATYVKTDGFNIAFPVGGANNGEGEFHHCAIIE